MGCPSPFRACLKRCRSAPRLPALLVRDGAALLDCAARVRPAATEQREREQKEKGEEIKER